MAVGQVEGRTIIVSGSDDATVRVWDAVTGTPVGDPYTGHTRSVTAVAVGQVDGRTIIVSGSNDRTMRVWTPPDTAGHTSAWVNTLVVDLAAHVYAVSTRDPLHIIAAGELGIASLRINI